MIKRLDSRLIKIISKQIGIFLINSIKKYLFLKLQEITTSGPWTVYVADSEAKA